MSEKKTRKVNRSIFAYRVVDVNNDTFGFAQDGVIYTYSGDSRTKGEAWLRMQKTGEHGKDRRKYFLYFGDETEYSAVVDKNMNVFDTEGHYIASLLHGEFIAFLIFVICMIVLITGLEAYLGGGVLMNTSTPFSDDNSINLEISDDDDSDWFTTDTLLDIFAVRDEDGNIINAKNEDRIVWPGMKGSYPFMINNNSEHSLRYKISFENTNEYGIPMRFKLLKGKDYVAGSETKWVSADELLLGISTIEKNEEIPYVLEWQWMDFDDVHDTKLGTEAIAKYYLNIEIDFEVAN